jgi:hypothetical protein
MSGRSKGISTSLSLPDARRALALGGEVARDVQNHECLLGLGVDIDVAVICGHDRHVRGYRSIERIQRRDEGF